VNVLDAIECFLFTICTVAILIGSSIVQPAAATCPVGTYLHTGVRADGRFECARSLVGPENDAVQPPGVLGGRVHCTGGSRPIVVNERVAGCQRGPADRAARRFR